MKNKFQFNFGAVPKHLLENTIALVAAQLKSNGWEFGDDYQRFCREFNDVYIIFGDRGNVNEWNRGIWKPSEFTVYHPLSDWDTWSKIKYAGDVIVKLNSTYDATVSAEDVRVGCQTFSHDAIFNLAAAIKNFKK